nr:hypothetical protein [Bacteroidales bacterium]
SFDEAGIIVAAVEHRVKAEKSLAGKLQLKGDKYKDIFDITDLVGLRVITFYICRVPESSYNDPEHPEINKIRFEVQMRTVLQHAWANMNHDTGYKSGIGINLG